MDLMKELNLTPMKRTVGRNPITERRESVINGIDKQIMVCEGLLEGKDVVRDQYTGRKIPQWFWLDDSGSYYLSINYGKSPIELAKGKFSIVCTGLEQVKSSLETVKSSVLKGDFDTVLDKRSKIIRSNFMISR
jgi:hypothetical protein